MNLSNIYNRQYMCNALCTKKASTHLVCTEQYTIICSKPARVVSIALRRVACSVHATYG